MTYKEKRKKLILKLIIGLAITAVLTAGSIIYGYEHLTWLIPAIGVLASIIVSKAYLILNSSKHIVGTIIKIDKKVYMTRVRAAGNKMDGAIIDDNYPSNGYREQKTAIFTLRLDSGKTITKEFVCGKIVEGLTTGDKISFTPLDDYPKVL